MANKNGAGPAQEEIAVRAYEIYLHRGPNDGDELTDWLQAERELNEGRAVVAAELAAPSRSRKASAAAGRQRVH